MDNKSKNNFVKKYNINNSGGYNNNNYYSNYFNKENEISNHIINRPNNNMNYNSNNNSSNIIKNIRVNKINNNNSNNNPIINRPENSKISSMNSTSKKEYDSNNININMNTKKPSSTYKKPLSHSNSTKEILSNNNMEKYLKIRQNQVMAQKKMSKNIYRQKKSYISNNSNSRFNRIPSSSKGNGASININNYYTNNIFNAIYNNFLPHQNYEKKNEPDSKYKKVAQRASSVFYQKRPIYKSSLEKNKNEGTNKISNRLIYKK
jgi:hypothetical protein